MEKNNGDREEHFYTVRDLARILKFSVGKIYHLHHDGRLPPPVALGRCLRWNRNVIVTWMENGCPPKKKHRKQRFGMGLKERGNSWGMRISKLDTE